MTPPAASRNRVPEFRYYVAAGDALGAWVSQVAPAFVHRTTLGSGLP